VMKFRLLGWSKVSFFGFCIVTNVAKLCSKFVHVVTNVDMPTVVLVFGKNFGCGIVVAQVKKQVDEQWTELGVGKFTVVLNSNRA